MQKQQNKERREKDVAFYVSIWNKSDKRCQVTGKYLGNEPLTTFFHHILSKSRFPEYRWCEWNILMVDPEVHAQIELDMDRVPGVRKLTEELMEKHLNGILTRC